MRVTPIPVRHLIGILLIALGINAYGFMFGWHRPYVNWSPSDLAQYLADHNRPASECMDLLYAQILAPTQAEQRARCVYEYAKLTKEPSACELLMPSSYGLSCVGAAENFELPCGTEAYSVYWNDGEKPRITTLKECNTEDPTRTELGNQCCHIAKVRYLLSENDCSSLKGHVGLYDRCLYDVAWKTRNPEYCYEISNENAHAACDVQTRALQKDPSICEGCTKPLENLEELK